MPRQHWGRHRRNLQHHCLGCQEQPAKGQGMPGQVAQHTSKPVQPIQQQQQTAVHAFSLPFFLSRKRRDVQLLRVGHGGLCPNCVVQRTCQMPFTGIVKIKKRRYAVGKHVLQHVKMCNQLPLSMLSVTLQLSLSDRQPTPPPPLPPTPTKISYVQLWSPSASSSPPSAAGRLSSPRRLFLQSHALSNQSS